MQTAIRDAVVAYLSPLYEAEYPTIPIVFDNGPFDWSAPPPLFSEVTLEFLGGEQVSLSSAPRRRVSGYAYITVRTRAGKGTREVLAMLDWFSTAMGFKRLAGVTFEVPQPDGCDEPPGWYMQHIKVGFISDPS